MPDVKRRYEVLYRNKPAWVVGEQDVDAAKRRVLPDVTRPEELYPNSFRGMAISVRQEGHPWTEKDLACSTRSLVTLDLTDEEVSALGSKKLKVDETGRTLLSISFEDRYGATAANLKRAFPDATVTTEDDERAELDAVIKVDQAEQLAYEDAMKGWKRAGAEAVIAMVLFDEPKPAAPIPSPVHEPVFTMEAVRLKRKLPATIVHSGAGLYEVGPTKTYSTIQSALDQLWTDQGSATFTASQYIRIFADTYDENVIPNAALNPVESSGYTLVIEGDPGDSRANIILQPTAGTYGFDVNCDHAIIRHMTVDGTSGLTSHSFFSYTGCASFEVRDCVVSAATDQSCIVGRYGLIAADCTLTANGGAGVIGNVSRSGTLVEGCFISQTGAVASYGVFSYHNAEVRGCVISGFQYGVFFSKGGNVQRAVKHCTIYGCSYGIHFAECFTDVSLLNAIFCSVDYAIRVSAWPDESAGTFAGAFMLRGNCFDYDAAFAYGPGGATKTYAEFSALDRVDASGDLDATDPLLTDPAGDDFSLAAASPCIRRVPGAGVPYDINGNPYATDRTDIGSVSSGTSSAAPGISAVSVSGNDYTATVTPGGAPNVRVRLMTRSGTEEDEEQRLSGGNVVLTAASAGDHTLVAWGCDAAGNPIGEPSAPFIVSVPSPVSSGGSMLRRTPHVVTLKRPAVVRDTDNNVASRDYNNPSKTVTIRCLFQTRGGEVSVGDEGQIVPFDSMLYTIEKDIEVNDRIEVALSFYTGNFLVVAVEPKGRVGGAYSHNQVSLQKDGVR